jgi:hypothetical protein
MKRVSALLLISASFLVSPSAGHAATHSLRPYDPNCPSSTLPIPLDFRNRARRITTPLEVVELATFLNRQYERETARQIAEALFPLVDLTGEVGEEAPEFGILFDGFTDDMFMIGAENNSARTTLAALSHASRSERSSSQYLAARWFWVETYLHHHARELDWNRWAEGYKRIPNERERWESAARAARTKTDLLDLMLAIRSNFRDPAELNQAAIRILAMSPMARALFDMQQVLDIFESLTRRFGPPPAMIFRDRVTPEDVTEKIEIFIHRKLDNALRYIWTPIDAILTEEWVDLHWVLFEANKPRESGN